MSSRSTKYQIYLTHLEGHSEEEKARRRKIFVNTEARERISAKKAEAEKAKFEEEILAEMARLEALM